MTPLTFPFVPTASELHDTEGDVYDKIKMLEELRVHVERPRNPNHIGIKTSAELFEIAEKMKVYEKEMEEYLVQEKECKFHNLKVDSLINAFISEESGFNTIPEQYRNKVFSKAWSDGHSDGYYAVYQELCELVEIFN